MAIRPPSPPGAVEIPVSLSTSVGKFTSLQYWSGSAFVTVAPGGGASWGGITGTLSDQTDLNGVLTSLSARIVSSHDSITSVNTVVTNLTNSLASVSTALQSGINTVSAALVSTQSAYATVDTALSAAIVSVQSALTSVDVALSSALVSVRKDTTYYYRTDFIELGTVALYGGVWGGAGFNSGNINGQAINSVEMSAHPGVRRIARASAGANSGYALTAFSGSLLLSGSESCNLIMQFNNALTSIQGYYGFINTATNTYPTNGCFFNVSPGGSIVAVNNRNGVSASSGVMLSAAVSTWYLLNVSISPVNATCAYYRIMDMAGSVLASANVTANIPVSAGFTTGNGLVVFYQASAAPVGLPLVDIDYMDLRFSKPDGRPI